MNRKCKGCKKAILEPELDKIAGKIAKGLMSKCRAGVSKEEVRDFVRKTLAKYFIVLAVSPAGTILDTSEGIV